MAVLPSLQAPSAQLLDRFLSVSGARLSDPTEVSHGGEPLGAHALALMVGGLAALGARPCDAWLHAFSARLCACLPECRWVITPLHATVVRQKY